MSEVAEKRRERARVAQRRSRAQRKANLEGLQRRVQTLTTALEEMTEICLGFSDNVISAIGSRSYETLQQDTKPFLRKILEIAGTALEDERAEESGAAGSKGVVDVLGNVDSAAVDDVELRTAWTGDVSRSQVINSGPLLYFSDPRISSITDRPSTPTLTYGVLPSNLQCLQQEYDPPMDIAKYVDNNRGDIDFAMALFWNTITLAYATISQPSSPLVKELFRYAIHFDPIDLIVSRIHRRMAFKPGLVDVYILPEIAAQDNWDVGEDRVLASDPGVVSGVAYEALLMDQTYRKIAESMKVEDGRKEEFVDATGVQERLRVKWGMALPPVRAAAVPLAHGSDTLMDAPAAEKALTCHNDLIWQLATRSRCLGNSIGFPVQVVDELAMQRRQTGW